MKKRYTSLILAAAISAAALVGCGVPEIKLLLLHRQRGRRHAECCRKRGTFGEITFWHSFTQGPRLETIQKAADKFMAENPGVKINIETFSGMTSTPNGPPVLLQAMCRI